MGKVAVASGFGADKYHKPQDNLMETNVTVISEEDCFHNIKDEVTGSAPKWNMSISEEDVRESLKTKICTKGSPINNNPDWTTGTREGDSGSALNFEEHERFQYKLIWMFVCTSDLLDLQLLQYAVWVC